MNFVERAGLKVDEKLAMFIERECLPTVGMQSEAFWSGAAAIFNEFTPENRALLDIRETIQTEINSWHDERTGSEIDSSEYLTFLKSIGYLDQQPETFTVSPENVDDEIAKLAGPQLVVPSRNARFVLNAGNARWGSLYDALYGTDAIPGEAKPGGYDPARGNVVIAWTKSFLDKVAPLASGSYNDVDGFSIEDGHLKPALKTPAQFAGYRGETSSPDAVLLRNNGLHIEILIDHDHPIGKTDKAGIADVIMESALSTIVDMEDSVAAVDVDDKIEAYSNWLGLIKGDLSATFNKGSESLTRTLNGDRDYSAPDGSAISLHGRSLLLVRNVGHFMTNPSVRLADGTDIFEGLLDGVVTSLIGMIDLQGKGRFSNSRKGSIYIVKPKMHGAREADFTNRLFGAIEQFLGLTHGTLKVGVMDEERRTSANLAACINAVRERIFFINTGFLDRTGDEIHTLMRAGVMIPKGEMKLSEWINAYEDRNVLIGLACGLAGRAQIGKGMWAAPDRMADMLEQKIGHPKSGANTAWTPSPTAATLHATHYHQLNVFERQSELATAPIPGLDKLLSLPLATGRNFSEDEVTAELENNIQGILGYVVRWIDQGVGCSKVPDIHDIGLMEDRATLRISSQHVANWLRWGVCSRAQVEAAFLKMAAKVDGQNKDDPDYEPMAPNPDSSLAFEAARALVLDGENSPNGYTEPLLHEFRLKKKAQSSA